jgi:hypothetical protein
MSLTTTTSTGFLVSQGPLTTLWTPPPSCLATTTADANYNYYVGFNNVYGRRAINLGCMIPTPTVLYTPTPSPLPKYTAQNGTLVTITTGYSSYFPFPTSIWTQTDIAAYYSPGICPSGYHYAHPCTMTPSALAAQRHPAWASTNLRVP